MANDLPVVPNFPELEKKWLEKWEKTGLYKKYLNKNETSNKRYSFIDGPITANNPMGAHHGWGRTYKDLWQKYHNLQGYKERFQNGFDCQGLWVEVEVEKELGIKNKKDIENLVPGDKYASIAKFVELCKERVRKYSAIQTEQSKRLGYFMDWEHSHFTMSEENNYMIWHFLKKVSEKGWIYKGADSVPWCPRCQTAISQHEMLTEDYKEIIHESIYLALPLVDKESDFLLVWTTTPWTIPANIAVAVDAKLNYCLVEDNNKRYWLAKELVESLFGENAKIVKTVKGKALANLKYIGPFDDLPAVQKVKQENSKFHTVILTDQQILPIVTTEGTGLVHTAVSAGSEDYKLGQKLGLPMIPIIDDEANYFTEGFGFLNGRNAKKHPELIIDYLKEKEGGKFLFKVLPYKHRYPACWRCKTELVWKVTEEWYIAMDKKETQNLKPQTFREKMIAVAKQIRWLPEFGLDRELDWLNNMHDWLISKPNRYWGLALPIYECKKCHHVNIIGSYEELKKKAVSGWDKFVGHTPHKPWIDEVKIKCENCSEPVSRLPDVGNVWLDAGIVPYSTLKYTTDQKYFKEWFPATFITESFPGQFKNWFYSMIAMSTALENVAPFKTVLGYGSCVGEDGRPMHKSWGNMIEFNEAADKAGADVMRWLYCRQDPTKNLPFGFKTLEEVRRQFHIPLWNSLKFYLTYKKLDSSDSAPVLVTKKDLSLFPILDQWILSRLVSTLEKVTEGLENYRADQAALSLEQLVNDLSLWYIRLSRERVWNNSTDQKDKKFFYQTLFSVLFNFSIILSPFLPFFSEEIYTHLTESESVHLDSWPQLPYEANPSIEADMTLIRQIVELGHSERKAKQIKVRQPLGNLTVFLETDFQEPKNQEKYAALIIQELNIKKVIWKKDKTTHIELDSLITEILKAEGDVRDLIHSVQQLRKQQGLSVTDYINLSLPTIPKDKNLLSVLKAKTLAKTVKPSNTKEIIITRAV